MNFFSFFVKNFVGFESISCLKLLQVLLQIVPVNSYKNDPKWLLLTAKYLIHMSFDRKALFQIDLLTSTVMSFCIFLALAQNWKETAKIVAPWVVRQMKWFLKYSHNEVAQWNEFWLEIERNEPNHLYIGHSIFILFHQASLLGLFSIFILSYKNYLKRNSIMTHIKMIICID